MPPPSNFASYGPGVDLVLWHHSWCQNNMGGSGGGGGGGGGLLGLQTISNATMHHLLHSDNQFLNLGRIQAIPIVINQLPLPLLLARC